MQAYILYKPTRIISNAMATVPGKHSILLIYLAEDYEI